MSAMPRSPAVALGGRSNCCCTRAVYRQSVVRTRASAGEAPGRLRSIGRAGTDRHGDIDFLVAAGRMAEAALALEIVTGLDRIIDDTVVVPRADPGRGGKPECLADAPGDVVIGARRVAAHAETADDRAATIESETTAEDVDAADPLTDHRILFRAIVVGIAAVGDGRIDRVAQLQPEKASSRLGRRIEIGRGQGRRG
jgi:hypothetical protein